MNEHWAGVDVGGRRKGFHVALVDGRRVLAGPRQLPTPADVAAWLAEWKPCLVGVDAPSVLGDDAVRFESERRLAREVCHLRYTPTRAALEYQRTTRAPKYYEWIEHGLELYAGLAAAGLDAVECFPTAAWTRWAGPRGARRRSVWTRDALAGLGLDDVPPRTNQDQRDAIAAAVTARAYSRGATQAFGEIVVPTSRS
jgi:predicted nuclease with RNAse H fold